MKKKPKKTKLSDEIIRAIYGNRTVEIDNWISKEGVGTVDNDGRNIVIHSLLAKNIIVLKLALGHQEDPNTKDRTGWYPLHYAAQDNSVEAADILIQNGAIIDSEDDYGNTPLWRAVFSYNGSGEMIEFLLKRGADLNHNNHSQVSPSKLANTIANYDVRKFFQ
ncbi:ankyrin repeat domain-containing protein [Pedobacter frigidisoli]|nr:ankyrin repeat domain-containing protein [Pedobacter frigidisoli]